MHSNVKYLRWLREQPCIQCGNPNSEPHHIIGIGLGEMGGKASDLHAVPLCREDHDEVHQVLDKNEKAICQLRWLMRIQDRAQSEGML